MSKIEKVIDVSASPERVYALLTTAAEFSELTGGAPADVVADEGAPFSLFGGMIVGRNVECLPGTRLVQAWRPKTWEEGDYSLVRFELESAGEGTKLRLVHTGFPPEQETHLSEGWEQNYLGPMKKHFS